MREDTKRPIFSRLFNSFLFLLSFYNMLFCFSVPSSVTLSIEAFSISYGLCKVRCFVFFFLEEEKKTKKKTEKEQ